MFDGKRVGVCISSFVYDRHSLQQISQCVTSFLANSTFVDEFYVTDDFSPTRFAYEFYNDIRARGVRVVCNHKNRGIGAMKNLALRLLSRCDIKFLVDGDTHVKKGWDEFYCRGLQVTKHDSVHLSNIFNDNEPFRQERIGDYTVNYHSKFQGAFMAVTKSGVERVGGFPLLPQRYGCEHYNWQVRLSRSLGVEPCVLDFAGGNQFVFNDHKPDTFITAYEKDRQSRVNGDLSNSLLRNRMNYMENQIEANGERGDDIGIIISFRAASWGWQGEQNNDRTANLMTVIDYYKSLLPNAEVLVVEQDKEPVIQTKLRGDVSYLFLKNKSTFNKCWAYNCAAQKLDRPYLIFMDCDAVLRPETIYASVIQIRHHGVFKPYVKFLDLPESYAAQFRNSMTVSWSDHNLGQRCAANEWFTGGCVMVRRKEYFQIGGFNENFRGWGGEDDEFIARARALVPTGRISGHGNNLYHLYHFVPRDATPDQPRYQANLDELNKVGSMNNAQLVDYVKTQLIPGMGNPEKYANE
jgi:glycosyltransferase involved in cell wall biosynthesis